jgi:hypothetical protein
MDHPTIFLPSHVQLASVTAQHATGGGGGVRHAEGGEPQRRGRKTHQQSAHSGIGIRIKPLALNNSHGRYEHMAVINLQNRLNSDSETATQRPFYFLNRRLKCPPGVVIDARVRCLGVDL